MGSDKYSYKFPNMGYNYSYLTYNPTYNYPRTSKCTLPEAYVPDAKYSAPKPETRSRPV